MKTLGKEIFSKGVILLIGVLVAILLFLSGFSLTNSALDKYSKTSEKQEVSLIQRYIVSS